MWRYVLGVGAALVIAIAGTFLLRGSNASGTRAALAPAPAAQTAVGEPLPGEAPRATDRTREEKRFDRYDKDRNAAVTREEYLASRRKAYARLDVNGDGRLDFDEWSVRTATKFAEADKDKSGALTRTEFTATAPKRKATPKCVCAPAAKPAPAPEKPAADDGDDQE